MKTIRKIGIFTIAVLLAACSGEAGNETAKTEENETGNGVDSIETVKEYPVRTQKLKMSSIPRTLDITANLTAYKAIDYAPVSPGRIEKINVEVGSIVKKGDVLVEMDKVQLNTAYTQLQNAKDNYDRLDTLYKLGSISEQQYEQMKTQYELAQTNAKFQADNAILKSPINGIVTEKYFEAGEMYSGVPNTAAGKAAVISLMQINPMKAVVSVSESFFTSVKNGMETTITNDLYSEEFIGKISRVYPTINQGTHTFQVEIIIDNKNEKLRPGMFSRIAINLGDAQAMVVPSIAVLKQEGTNNRYVFVYENGKAKQILVTVGERYDDLVEVISDEIHEGMELIVEGQANLLNGSKVIKK